METEERNKRISDLTAKVFLIAKSTDEEMEKTGKSKADIISAAIREIITIESAITEAQQTAKIARDIESLGCTKYQMNGCPEHGLSTKYHPDAIPVERIQNYFRTIGLFYI